MQQMDTESDAAGEGGEDQPIDAYVKAVRKKDSSPLVEEEEKAAQQKRVPTFKAGAAAPARRSPRRAPGANPRSAPRWPRRERRPRWPASIPSFAWRRAGASRPALPRRERADHPARGELMPLPLPVLSRETSRFLLELLATSRGAFEKDAGDGLRLLDRGAWRVPGEHLRAVARGAGRGVPRDPNKGPDAGGAAAAARGER